MTIATPSASFTRPADTTAYTASDLVANDTTAADVVAMAFRIARGGGSGVIWRARLISDTDAPTNKTVRLHLWSSDPVATAPTNGDNGAMQIAAGIEADYLGSIAIDLSTTNGDVHASGNVGSGVPLGTTGILFDLGSADAVIYGLLEATGAFTPASGEVFTTFLEIELADE